MSKVISLPKLHIRRVFDNLNDLYVTMVPSVSQTLRKTLMPKRGPRRTSCNTMLLEQPGTKPGPLGITGARDRYAPLANVVPSGARFWKTRTSDPAGATKESPLDFNE
jgi:hypothetical protein